MTLDCQWPESDLAFHAQLIVSNVVHYSTRVSACTCESRRQVLSSIIYHIKRFTGGVYLQNGSWKHKYDTVSSVLLVKRATIRNSSLLLKLYFPLISYFNNFILYYYEHFCWTTSDDIHNVRSHIITNRYPLAAAYNSGTYPALGTPRYFPQPTPHFELNVRLLDTKFGDVYIPLSDTGCK